MRANFDAVVTEHDAGAWAILAIDGNQWLGDADGRLKRYHSADAKMNDAWTDGFDRGTETAGAGIIEVVDVKSLAASAARSISTVTFCAREGGLARGNCQRIERVLAPERCGRFGNCAGVSDGGIGGVIAGVFQHEIVAIFATLIGQFPAVGMTGEVGSDFATFRQVVECTGDGMVAGHKRDIVARRDGAEFDFESAAAAWIFDDAQAIMVGLDRDRRDSLHIELKGEDA